MNIYVATHKDCERFQSDIVRTVYVGTCLERAKSALNHTFAEYYYIDKIIQSIDVWENEKYIETLGHKTVMLDTQFKRAEYFWAQLADIPIDNDENILEPFNVFFQKGTNRLEIWHWFENTFDVSIVDLQHVPL